MQMFFFSFISVIGRINLDIPYRVNIYKHKKTFSIFYLIKYLNKYLHMCAHIRVFTYICTKMLTYIYRAFVKELRIKNYI